MDSLTESGYTLGMEYIIKYKKAPPRGIWCSPNIRSKVVSEEPRIRLVALRSRETDYDKMSNTSPVYCLEGLTLAMVWIVVLKTPPPFELFHDPFITDNIGRSLAMYWLIYLKEEPPLELIHDNSIVDVNGYNIAMYWIVALKKPVPDRLATNPDHLTEVDDTICHIWLRHLKTMPPLSLVPSNGSVRNCYNETIFDLAAEIGTDMIKWLDDQLAH